MVSRRSHLFGVDIMHHMNPNILVYTWDKWDRPLMHSINTMIQQFITSVSRSTEIPDYAMMIV